MKTMITLAGLILSSTAIAYPEQPSPQAGPSPALQMARRVASMENERDLPSRAVWLGRKVAHSSRMASYHKPVKKQAN